MALCVGRQETSHDWRRQLIVPGFCGTTQPTSRTTVVATTQALPSCWQPRCEGMATTALRCTLRVSAPASLTKTTLRRAAPRRAAPPARAAKNRGEGAPTELAQRSRKDELVFDSAPALASAPSGASLARQLYSEACEAAVNAQINIEVRLRSRCAACAAPAPLPRLRTQPLPSRMPPAPAPPRRRCGAAASGAHVSPHAASFGALACAARQRCVVALSCRPTCAATVWRVLHLPRHVGVLQPR